MTAETIKANPTPTGVHVIREPKELIGRVQSAEWGEDLQLECDEGFEATDLKVGLGILPDAERHIAFGLIRDPRLRIRKPIPIDISVEGDTTVATWTEAEEFGYGANRAEAIEDFGQTITQLFITLTREESLLADDLRSVLEMLREYLEFRTKE
jgi:hypothetical protein